MMSEHEHTEPQPDERAEELEDLDVPEGQQEDVAGGVDMFMKIKDVEGESTDTR
jgi:hypothetical protein